jgi:hypothetical protein
MTNNNKTISLAFAQGVPAAPIAAGSCGSSVAWTLGWSFVTYAGTESDNCQAHREVEPLLMRCQYRLAHAIMEVRLRKAYPDLPADAFMVTDESGTAVPLRNYPVKLCRGGVPYEVDQRLYTPEEAAELVRRGAITINVNSNAVGTGGNSEASALAEDKEEASCSEPLKFDAPEAGPAPKRDRPKGLVVPGRKAKECKK